MIGILDSGIGGVSVLKEIIKRNGGGNFIYLADNAMMPYGNKTKEEIQQRVTSLIDMLKNKYKVDKVIVACNTASSLLETDDNDIIKMQFNKEDTYIGTHLTKKQIGDNVIELKSLARIIENNINNKDKLDRIIKRYIDTLRLRELDSLLLGCTHYELVNDIFKKHMPNTNIINNSERMGLELLDYRDNSLNLSVILTKQSKSYQSLIFRLIKEEVDERIF
ncbi:MAG: hypothetical protein E7374_02835 [Clostridiales bacterium]|nr:hypothetical protein [Clostridiales bacterium]